MYAVVATGGKQYKVQVGEVLRVEKLAGAVGSEIDFDQILIDIGRRECQHRTPCGGRRPGQRTHRRAGKKQKNHRLQV